MMPVGRLLTQKLSKSDLKSRPKLTSEVIPVGTSKVNRKTPPDQLAKHKHSVAGKPWEEGGVVPASHTAQSTSHSLSHPSDGFATTPARWGPARASVTTWTGTSVARDGPALLTEGNPRPGENSVTNQPTNQPTPVALSKLAGQIGGRGGNAYSQNTALG